MSQLNDNWENSVANHLKPLTLTGARQDSYLNTIKNSWSTIGVGFYVVTINNGWAARGLLFKLEENFGAVFIMAYTGEGDGYHKLKNGTWS